MLKKSYLLLLLIMVSVASLGETYWDGEKGKLRIMYKLLDPLIVTVEQPTKIKTNTLNREFTYSSKNNGHRIKVNVRAPYNDGVIDNYLREIYKNVYFELEKQGEFDLNNTTKKDALPIKGKGYFVDESSGVYAKDKKTFYTKEFSNRVSGNAFVSSTEIDVDFKLPDGEVPMGVYKGTLTLNVWFSGGIK